MILCGFSLARRRVIIAILLLCGGWVLLSLSSGYLLTAAMMFLALALSFHSTWQSKRYLLTLIGAIVVSLPLLILYPLVLSKTNPEWFDIWFNHYSLGVFGGFHQIQTAFNLPYYLKNLLWFALPAWPLAAWTLSRTRIHDKNWDILSLSWLVIMTALLAINPQRLQDNLVWLLPPLALLGAAQLDGLRRGAAAFINWFGIMAFGLIAVFLWLGFFAMNYGWPAKLAERAAYFSPYYIPDIDPIPMAVALLFTPLWLWAITRKNIRGRQAVTNWAAGVTLAWALLMTLFLPWLNAAKSHAPVVHQMEAALSSELKQQLQTASNVSASTAKTSAHASRGHNTAILKPRPTTRPAATASSAKPPTSAYLRAGKPCGKAQDRATKPKLSYCWEKLQRSKSHPLQAEYLQFVELIEKLNKLL